MGKENGHCTASNLEYPVSSHSSVVSSLGVITCGGHDGKSRLKKCTLQKRDGETKMLPSMIRPRSAFGMVVINQTLIVVGGNGAFNKMETINLQSGQWNEVDLPFTVGYHCVVSINDTMILSIGGYDEKDNVSYHLSHGGQKIKSNALTMTI